MHTDLRKADEVKGYFQNYAEQLKNYFDAEENNLTEVEKVKIITEIYRMETLNRKLYFIGYHRIREEFKFKV